MSHHATHPDLSATPTGTPAAKTPIQALEEKHRAALAAGRARRAERRQAAVTGPTADTPTAERLGRDRGYASAAGQDTDGGRRGARYAAREILWEVSTRKGARLCGKVPVAGGVATALNQAGQASHMGLMHCGLIWICPVCSAKIRAVRADTLAVGSVAWTGAGHGVALVTLTIRHYNRQALKQLTKYVTAAWRKAFSGRPWKAAQATYGITGYARALEVTHGEANGWHVHLHVLFFLDRPWSHDQAEAFQGETAARWADACGAVGAYRPSAERGVRVDVLAAGSDPSDLARYVMKGQDGKRAAFELADPDTKRGKAGHRTPFEILAAFVATGDADDLDLWQEYEGAMTGMRALVWSRGMKDILAELVDLDDRTDEEIVQDDTEGMIPVALIPADTWREHVVRHRGRSLELLHAAEAGAEAGVRSLIESWGLVWGRDVLPAPEVEE
ncbi:protein rep [Streptomyces sp. NPDC003388]